MAKRSKIKPFVSDQLQPHDADEVFDRRGHGQGARQQGLLPRSRPQKEGQEGGQGQAGGALQARQEQVVFQQAPLLNEILFLSLFPPSACLCPVVVTLALWRYM